MTQVPHSTPAGDALRSCDLCEETLDEPEDGALHRWHAEDGSTIDLCAECLRKSFELLWRTTSGRVACPDCDGTGEEFIDSMTAYGVPGGWVATGSCQTCKGRLFIERDAAARGAPAGDATRLREALRPFIDLADGLPDDWERVQVWIDRGDWDELNEAAAPSSEPQEG